MGVWLLFFYRVDRRGFYEKEMFEQRLKGNEGVRLGSSYVKGFSGKKKTTAKALWSNPMLEVLEEEPGGQYLRTECGR